MLRRHGLSRLGHLDRPTRVPLRYERSRPGELLHIDVKKLGRIPDGGGHRMLGRSTATRRAKGERRIGYDFLHACVDDHSRVAYVEVHPDERGETTSAFLLRVGAFFAERGVAIERVMTDNFLLHAFGGVQRSPGHPRRPSRVDPRVQAPGQRQGRAVQPDAPHGVGRRWRMGR